MYCGSLQQLLFVIFVVFLYVFAKPASAANLTACFLNEHGSDGLFYNFDRHGAAVIMAIQYANDVILPKNMTIVPVFRPLESVCLTKGHAVSYAMEIYSAGIKCDVYVGPGCTGNAEALYEFASFSDKLLIGLPAGGIGINSPIISYDLLARLSITHINTANAIIFFLRRYNYTDLTVIYDNENNFYQQLSIVVQEVFIEIAFDIVSTTKFIGFDPKNLTEQTINNHLQTNRIRSRGSGMPAARMCFGMSDVFAL